jgi:hypothetical protein
VGAAVQVVMAAAPLPALDSRCPLSRVIVSNALHQATEVVGSSSHPHRTTTIKDLRLSRITDSHPSSSSSSSSSHSRGMELQLSSCTVHQEGAGRGETRAVAAVVAGAAAVAMVGVWTTSPRALEPSRRFSWRPAGQEAAPHSLLAVGAKLLVR